MAPKGDADPKVKPSAFCHIVLYTTQYEKMKKFYFDALGMEVQFENETLGFLTYDSEHHRVALVNVPPVFKDNARFTKGLAHFAYAYPTMEALADAYEARKAKGIMPYWCVNHGMTMSMYYSDPDGNELECQVDVMNNDEANAFMYGPEFKVNPIGVDYDPEEFVKMVRAKAPLSKITDRGNVVPRGPLSVPSGKYGPSTPLSIARGLWDTWGTTLIAIASTAGYLYLRAEKSGWSLQKVKDLFK